MLWARCGSPGSLRIVGVGVGESWNSGSCGRALGEVWEWGSRGLSRMGEVVPRGAVQHARPLMGRRIIMIIIAPIIIICLMLIPSPILILILIFILLLIIIVLIISPCLGGGWRR